MIDLRNLFDRDTVLANGFERYHGLGVTSGVRKRRGRSSSRPPHAGDEKPLAARMSITVEQRSL